MRAALFPVTIFAASLALSGCDNGKRNRAEPEDGAKAANDSAERPPAPATPPAQEEDFGDWEVETFSAAAGEQLALIKEFLKGGELGEAFSEARSPGLTGFDTVDFGTSQSFAVRRAETLAGEPVPARQALAALREHFADRKVTLAEIKIVHVDLSGELAATELYVHLADERRQINAVWEAAWSRNEPPLLRSIETKRYEECERLRPGKLADATGSVLPPSDPAFEQLARSLDHWVARIETTFGIQVGGWHGVAAADVNGDGLDDLHLSDGGGLPNRLLVQNPDGTVRDASRQSGLDFLDHTHGALFADFDNDGDQDAALAMLKGVLILENDGTGTFTPLGAKLLPHGSPYSLCAADYDQDGDLDLYASCYTANRGPTRHSIVARPVPYHDADNGGRNVLLRNEGGLRFRNVTRAAGLDVRNTKYSYSGSWDDYDGDGDLDLYVANDFGSNCLYQNQLAESGEPVFREGSQEAGVRDVAAGMSACWGDYNNDGRADLYVGNMFSSAGNRITFQQRFKPGRDAATRAIYQRHARGNSLFRNAGSGTFEDVSVASETTMGRWAWSSLFCDLDNDGWEDLLVANGFITQDNPADL